MNWRTRFKSVRLSTVAIAALGAFLLWGAVSTDGLFGSVTAAWVQAIGAIAAITFAATQAADIARLERERKAAPLEVCIYGASRALRYYDNFRETAQDHADVPGWARSHLIPGIADRVTGVFDEISLRDMPSPITVEALIEARTLAAFFVARVQAAADGKPGWDENSANTRAKMVIVWKTFQEERDRILGRAPRRSIGSPKD
ncbi:MAG: hypothetical protein ACREEO_09670 [Phenylobacterium sp.]